MRDMHCHILPGVDDGAHNLQESLEMLEAAKQVGITSIVCTPHCRDPYFDFDAMWEAFRLLEQHANGFPLTMGFEVNHAKLMDLGIEWAPKLAFQGTFHTGYGIPLQGVRKHHLPAAKRGVGCDYCPSRALQGHSRER